jgi:F-type H+-transporting ATPase subunit epsilon
VLPTKLTLEVVTPERRVLSHEVDEVVLPGTEGYLGVLPGHAPLLTALGVGVISYRDATGTHQLAVSGGFAEVQRGHVLVLAETSERAEEIDVDRAERARASAQQALAQHPAGEEAHRRAEVELEKARTRLRVGGRAS